ncbi:MAG: hypothetical protein GY853_02125 [PVC group bacterium]|nr:hypothetical protein [PVC group bacterium]
MAFPITLWFFANSLTFGFRGLAVSNAVRSLANSNALGAVKHFASFIRAFNFTIRLLAFDIANSVFGFSATSMALRRLTDRIANGGAVRIITFPGALGMALLLNEL